MMRCRFGADTGCRLAAQHNMRRESASRPRLAQDVFIASDFVSSDPTLFLTFPVKTFDKVEWTTGELQSNLGRLSEEERT